MHVDIDFLSKSKVFPDFNIAEVSKALKISKYLDYEKFQPNLLVKRKKFGDSNYMVLSLTKEVSDRLRKELGITGQTIDYNAPQIEETVPLVSKAPTRKKKEDLNKSIQSGNQDDKSEELTLLLKYLSLNTLNEVDYMQKSEDGSSWAIFAPAAIKAFMTEERKGANRINLSRSLTALGSGFEDISTPTGKKKFLLIKQELIG